MRLKLISLTILLILFLSLNGYSLEEKIAVAILKLELAEIDSNTGKILTDRLRDEILNTGKFDVMERNRMDEILQEQGFQQTGACNTDECIVEAGRLLGVTHIIGGSVGRVGSIYTVTARLIDVETGRIVISVTEDSEGPLENVLTISLHNVAKKLSASAATATITTLGYGSLHLASSPPGARIFIDDRAVPEITPATIDSVKAGVRMIRMQKDLLAGSKAIFVAPYEKTEVHLELSLSKGKLKIITEPEGVDIYIDYNSRGISPELITDLTVGSYYLKLSKKGYVDYTRIVTIKENEISVITTRMIPMSFFSLTSNPPDCEVFLDDSLIGKAPISTYNLKPGFHKVLVKKSGFVNYEITQSFPAGELTPLDLTLEQVAGITIKSEPAEIEVYINGDYRGLTPLTIDDLKPGAIDVKLSGETYLDYMTWVNLAGGTVQELKCTMNKKKGSLTVESIPADAVVEIDGVKKGNTRLRLNDVEYGKHLLRVTKPGYEAYSEEFEIKDDLPKIIHVEFKIARGLLFLHPSPKDAIVFLDGKKLNQVSAEGIKLLPGQYSVKAIRPGYEKFEITTDVKPDEGISLNLKLQEKTKQQAIIRSFIFPGWGQRYAEKQTRMHLFSILELTALSGILISDLVYDSKITDYNHARKNYFKSISKSDIEKYRSNAEDFYDGAKAAKDVRTKFLLAAVGVWAFNILDSAIFEPIRPVTVPDYYGLNVSINF